LRSGLSRVCIEQRARSCPPPSKCPVPGTHARNRTGCAHFRSRPGSQNPIVCDDSSRSRVISLHASARTTRCSACHGTLARECRITCRCCIRVAKRRTRRALPDRCHQHR
jgi:hypothetical protein